MEGKGTIKHNISIVCVGYGDSELIAMKGVHKLESADVVMYSDFHYSLLTFCPIHTKRILIDVADPHSIAGEVKWLMDQQTSRALHIVILKENNPFEIKDRFNETISEYFPPDVAAFEIIPGVNGVVSLTAQCQIPLTKRGTNESFIVVKCDDVDMPSIIPIAVQTSATIIVINGISRLGEILNIYRMQGKFDLSIGIIEKNSCPAYGAYMSGSIHSIQEMLIENSPSNDAIIIIGDNVQQNEAFKERVLKPAELNFF